MPTDAIVKSLTRDEAITAQLFDKEVTYIHDPLFDTPKANFSKYPLDAEPVWTWASALLGEFTEETEVAKFDLVLLDREQERNVFLHMNWHFCQWAKIQKEVKEAGKATRKQITAAKKHKEAALYAREQISLFNLGLVFAVCKKFDKLRRGKTLTSQDRWTEALSAMLRTIDKFNVEYGFKFSTYFFNAAYNSLTRYSKKESQVLNNFVPESRLIGGGDRNYEVNSPLEGGIKRVIQRETMEERFSSLDPRAIDIVFRMLINEPEGTDSADPNLTLVEKSAFILRYGSEEKRTLQQIAIELGNNIRDEAYSKERVRMASLGAIKKIRARIEEELPGEMPSFID